MANEKIFDRVQQADQVWQAADTLGHAVALVEKLERQDFDFGGNSDDADVICIQGMAVIRAMRAIAMRLDRATCIRNAKDD